jgi:hypothetical protein
MKFTLLIFSLVAKQFLHRMVLTSELNKAKNINIYDGYDHRYLNTNDTFATNDTFSTNNTMTTQPAHQAATLEDIYRFNGYFYKLKLLNKLTSPEISLKEKIASLEAYEGYNNKSKYATDLTAGGLYKDWNNNDEFTI